MGRTIIVSVLLALALFASSASGKTLQPADPQLAAEAQRGLEEILDLWREGNYAGLYERTSVTGKESREGLAKKLAAAPRRPSCCWEKMQDVRVSSRSDDAVTVRAKFGLEGGPGGTEYATRSLRLAREGGRWTVSQADILSLAGASKKKYRRVKKRERIESAESGIFRY